MRSTRLVLNPRALTVALRSFALLGVALWAGCTRPPAPPKITSLRDPVDLILAKLRTAGVATTQIHETEADRTPQRCGATSRDHKPKARRDAPCPKIPRGTDDTWWILRCTRNAIALHLDRTTASLWISPPGDACLRREPRAHLKPITIPITPARDAPSTGIECDAEDGPPERATLKVAGRHWPQRVICASQGFAIIDPLRGTVLHEGKIPQEPPPTHSATHKAADDSGDSADDGDHNAERRHASLDIFPLPAHSGIYVVRWTHTRVEGGSTGNESTRVTKIVTLWNPSEGRKQTLFQTLDDTNPLGGGGGSCSPEEELKGNATVIPFRRGWLVRQEQDTSRVEVEDQGSPHRECHRRATLIQRWSWRLVTMNRASVELAEGELVTPLP